MNRLAIYLRLSKEDYQKKKENESISNQREYIRNYIKGQKEFKECELIEYVDDGFSGTNPNRPAYQRLLEDIRNNQVNILVVKDILTHGKPQVTAFRSLDASFTDDDIL